MSETITEEKTNTEENITTIDHTSATENVPGQEDTSASGCTVAQENASAVNNAAVQEEAAASDNITAQKNIDVQPQKETSSPSFSAPGTESSYNPDSEMDPFDKAEKERDSSGFFARFSAKIANIHSRREARLVRDEIILSRIPDKDLMEYLKLEQKRLESQQHAREIREKRIWIAFQMTIALIAAVLVIYFLKDSPAILISILYTAGLLIAFNIWNKHKDGRSPKDQ